MQREKCGKDNISPLACMHKKKHFNIIAVVCRMAALSSAPNVWCEDLCKKILKCGVYHQTSHVLYKILSDIVEILRVCKFYHKTIVPS